MNDRPPVAARRLSNAGLETLARVHAVGTCTWFPGDQSSCLYDAWLTPLHSSTVANLVRDGYLVGAEDPEADFMMKLSEEAIAVVDAHPEIRQRARDYYAAQAELAERHVRLMPNKPDFKRTTMSREVPVQGKGPSPK